MKARVAGNGEWNKKYYADRGITMCERWNDFEAFLADMGECPPGKSIERIDNDGNYEPDNCEWATRKQQSANTRRTHRVVLNGRKMCLREAISEIGGLYSSAMRRMRLYGLSAQGAVNYELQCRRGTYAS